MHCIRSLLLAVALFSPSALVHAAVPPEQPDQGPGGKVYRDDDIIKRAVGSAEEPVFVFHGKTKPSQSRSVFVFLHSWGGNDPRYFGGWIEHLARRGHLVLFPRYQEINRTRPSEATEIASRMVRDALKGLANDPDAMPDAEKIVYVGYLAGSIVALDLAARATEYRLPAPKLILNLMPGGIAKDGDSRGIPMPDLSKIAASTLLVAMNGDQEHIPSDRAAKRIFTESTHVPHVNKLFIRMNSDRHGYPTLSASLASPGSNRPEYAAEKIPLPPSSIPQEEAQPVKGKGKQAAKKPQKPKVKWSPDAALTGPQTTLSMLLGFNGIDNLDYRGFWKTLDLLSEAAFSGKDMQTLKGNSMLMDMGSWSDGWPVRRLSADNPKE